MRWVRTLLVVSAALLAAAVAPHPAHADCRAAPADVSTIACAVNAVRADYERLPLRAHPDLARAAGRHADEMVARRFFAHVSPDGRTLLRRVRAAGYLRAARSWWLGEILAWAASGSGVSAGSIVAMWMDSPSHRALLLSSRARELGVGVASGRPTGGDAGPAATVTLDIGRVRRAG